jgi:hypothetical protein
MSLLSNKPSESLPDVEAVAAKHHEGWVKAQQGTGVFSSKKRPTDPTEEELMVPYGQLSDAAKAGARAPVIAVYTCLDALAEEAADSPKREKKVGDPPVADVIKK